MKTRDRILVAARNMFNEHGFGNVSVAMLAKELKMAKGNLWYHFNDKRSLLDALSQEFIELDDERRKIGPIEDAVLESYVHFLNTLASEIREFRFLFRDHSDYGEHSEVMLQHLPIIYEESSTQFSQFYKAMRKAGYLNIDDGDIESLVWNVIVILRYNLEFLRERRMLAVEGSGPVLQTLHQHLTLFADKLSPPAIKFFNTAFADEPALKEAI